ncbi:MAG: alpha/beta fold hydrolase [Acidimicrobiia bacterium]
MKTESDYYRIHFRLTCPHPAQLEQIVGRLRSNFTEASVLLARAIEHRLYDQTWLVPGYDLLPLIAGLDLPTLVLQGEHDFVPVEIPTRIAAGMLNGRLTVLGGCGHFAYFQSPDLVRRHVAEFLRES